MIVLQIGEIFGVKDEPEWQWQVLDIIGDRMFYKCIASPTQPSVGVDGNLDMKTYPSNNIILLEDGLDKILRKL